MLERTIRAIRRGYPPEQAEEAIAKLREAREILGGDIVNEPSKRPRHFFNDEQRTLSNKGYVVVDHSGKSLNELQGRVSAEAARKLGVVLEAKTAQRSIAFHPHYTEVVPADFIDREEYALYFKENELFTGDQVKQGEGIGVVFLGTPRDYFETVLTTTDPEVQDVFSGRLLTRDGVMTIDFGEEHRTLTWSLDGNFAVPAKLIPLIQPKSR